MKENNFLDEKFDFYYDNDRENKIKSTVKLIAALFSVSILLSSFFSVLIVPMGGALNKSYDYWEKVPVLVSLEKQSPEISEVYDQEGNIIATFYSENREEVAYEDINKNTINALLAIEDSRFFEHKGLDIKGTTRAFIKNRGGGSTLTQQYAKNLILFQANNKKSQKKAVEKTYKRKILELKSARYIEEKMTKEEIIVGYLNIVNFSEGVYGIGAASKVFFSKKPKDLTIAESAFLVGILQRPEFYSPIKNIKNALKKKDIVLKRMLETNKITEKDFEQAKTEKIELKINKTKNGCTSSKHPFYCERVKEEILNDKTYGETKEERLAFLHNGGLKIKTNLSPKLHREMMETAKKTLGVSNPYGTGISLVEPGTGKILGFGVNREFGKGKGKTFVNYAHVKHQPGSTFKPFVLATAMENGTKISDIKTAKSKYCINKSCFRNAASYDSGNMNSEEALVMSSNTFFVEMAVEQGIKEIQKKAKEFGLDMSKAKGVEASTALGVHEQSPTIMAAAYATFSAHGKFCKPKYIEKIKKDNEEYNPLNKNCEQIISPATSDQISHALKGVFDSDDPRRTAKNISLPFPAAGKTGTTQNNAAMWFSGFSTKYSIAVWVGHPEGGFKNPVHNISINGKRQYRISGATVAGPIWEKAMIASHKGLEIKDFPIPSINSENISKEKSSTPFLKGQKIKEAVSILSGLGLKWRTEGDGAYVKEIIKDNEILVIKT